ncbi:conserved hypothetical protein [Nitrosococcus halophilus Nc 4]|uniref:Uncharacterized protein n=2 Tax=Nitrosococcus halophilus TaxID=133539 RepID=D5C0L6_NITHN|nr:conserved hypothetical protein [Nitrosococcus halophilus Nc 4]
MAVLVCLLLIVFPFLVPDRTDRAAPYPPSAKILDMVFDMSTVQTAAPGSDNWPITWADDNHQYTSWGDGGGFGGTNREGRVSMGFARIEGTKDHYQGFNVWGGKGSKNSAKFGGKSYGLISIDGVMYMWRCGPGSNAGVFKSQQLFKSMNHAASWDGLGWELTPRDFPNTEGFFCPTFLQFGKDYQGARDNYIYMYATENKGGADWDVQIPGEITLIRVPKSKIEDWMSYEFFAGFDNNGNPQWTSNVAKRKPVFEDVKNGVLRPSVAYIQGIDRYILIAQQVSRHRKNNGHIGIYDAPEPWGPWTTVLFGNPWDIGSNGNLQSGHKTVFWGFSTKWSKGNRFVMVYTGPGSDNWGTIEGSFVTSD